ncbi:MAG: DUF1836 domain-containing protein [Mollicutes bacterium]|nr:DUF1836 domain-containing protein [Mollicutes bacterium]MDD7264393.1 DUF1836 domain-containing protein [bacterium]MDY4979085.1 DUF1836 domain-containing protein [Candidatus Onthovivens sp.]
MGQALENIENYIKKLEEFELPEFNDLPNIPLYMEQVVGYVSEVLDALEREKDLNITPFMVNNYVKAKIIEPPKEKKYNRRQISYLIAISLMKSVVSMRDLATFIDLDEINVSDKDSLYAFFKKMEDESIHNVVHKVKVRNEVLKKSNKKSKKDSPESEEQNEQSNFAYIALKLYIDSAANKMIADYIMRNLSSEVLSKKVYEESEVTKYNYKKNKVEAKILRERQRKVKDTKEEKR